MVETTAEDETMDCWSCDEQIKPITTTSNTLVNVIKCPLCGATDEVPLSNFDPREEEL